MLPRGDAAAAVQAGVSGSIGEPPEGGPSLLLPFCTSLNDPQGRARGVEA